MLLVLPFLFVLFLFSDVTAIIDFWALHSLKLEEIDSFVFFMILVEMLSISPFGIGLDIVFHGAFLCWSTFLLFLVFSGMLREAVCQNFVKALSALLDHVISVSNVLHFIYVLAYCWTNIEALE